MNYEGGELRDPAEYTEASVLPAEIEDTLEDELREVVGNEFPPDLFQRLVEYVQLQQGETRKSNRHADRIRLATHLLETFNPRKWNLINCWALHFAIESRHTKNVSPRMICIALNCHRQFFSRKVIQWRRKLGLPANKDLWRESRRLTRKYQK